MQVGQFWSIPLDECWFACGRVLQLNEVNGKRHTRLFLAGLMDWIGNAPPTFESISGAGIVSHGAAHVKTISANEGQILGCRELSLDGIEIPETVEATELRRGFHVVGLATREQRASLTLFTTWGFEVIVLLAERLLRERLGA
jgi:hypothetical protein